MLAQVGLCWLELVDQHSHAVLKQNKADVAGPSCPSGPLVIPHIFTCNQNPMLVPACKTYLHAGDQQCWIFQQVSSQISVVYQSAQDKQEPMAYDILLCMHFSHSDTDLTIPSLTLERPQQSF